MVRVTFTVLAMCVSALAATIHDTRDLGARSEPELVGRDIPAMVLERRQDKAPDSPQMAQLKKDRDAISPELTQARQGVKDAMDKVPQEFKDGIKAARQKEKDTFNGLDQATKDKLKAVEGQFRAAREAEKSSAAPSPDAAAPPPAA